MHDDQILSMLFEGETLHNITQSLGLNFKDVEDALKDTDSVICRHCETITHIGGLIGPSTNDCPFCGHSILKG